MKVCSFCLSVFVSIFCIQHLAAKIIIYPAPKAEPLNTFYKLSANGQTIPVYNAKVGMDNNVQRFKAVDDLLNSASYFDVAAFAYFDMSTPVTLTVSTDNPVSEVKILPESAGVKFTIHQSYISFQLAKPQNLTVEINGEITGSLHIFADPIDNSIPNRQDPNVLFFGPGIHYLPATVVKSHQTLYVAGGAIVRVIIGKDEKYSIERSGLKNYEPRISLIGNDIKICGHGIIDAGDCPVHAGNFILINGNHISISGVILRNSCGWTVPVRRSDFVLADNVKILGYRANSDGIDVCNSSDVEIKNCFIRTGDDLIVIKTEKGEGEANRISIKNCTLWNEIAHPLSIGDETNEHISNIQFTDCEIIHDKGRECSLSISCADSALVENVTFKNIKIDEGNLFVSLWIGKDAASSTSKYGIIKSISFQNITADHINPQINMNGVNNNHFISGVKFSNVLLNNQPLSKKNVNSSSFVSNLVIMP